MHLKGMENIVGRILADAETSAAEIKAQSDAAVAEVMAAANTQAEQVYAQGLKSAKAEVENVLLRGKSMADLEGRKALLTARQSVIDEAFSAAVDQLQKKRKDKDGYTKLLADLAKPHLQADSAVVLDKADFSGWRRSQAGAGLRGLRGRPALRRSRGQERRHRVESDLYGAAPSVP